jgi:flagellar basal body P-ring protein FlgI
MNGFYVAYFNAEFGTSLGMFTIKDGTIVGADIGGTMYKGHLKVSADGQTAECNMNVSTRAPGMTITGAQSDLPINYDTKFELKLPLENTDYHRIESIAGPVNVRFEKVMGYE